MLKLKLDTELYTKDNQEYGFVVSNTNELVLVAKSYTDCIKKIGFFNVKGKALEEQKVLLIPYTLQIYLSLMANMMQDWINSMDDDSKEENKNVIMEIDFKPLQDKIVEVMDNVFSKLRQEGQEMDMSLVNRFYNSLEYESHPLDKSLNLMKLEKIVSDRDYRIKKEYSIKFGLEYSITIGYTKYMYLGDDKIVLEFKTITMPYEVGLKIEELMKQGE